MTEPIPLARPALTAEAADAVAAVLRSGHLVQGRLVAELQSGLCQALGTKHAVAVSNGTAALEVALAAVGVGPGDEVVMPDFTFPSLANVIQHLGAIPVTVDISLATFNAPQESLLAAVTEHTRAVVPVHQFGLPVEITSLVEAGEEQGFVVVEDAACALDARFVDGAACGTRGVAGCFSFHPRKQLTTAEGGAIVTSDAVLHTRMASLANHGMLPADDYLRFHATGWNCRMSDVHAAVGAGQLERLAERTEERRAVAARLAAALEPIEGIDVPAGHHDPAHTFQSFVVLVGEELPRDGVLAGLAERGVGATIGSYAVHRQPQYVRAFPKRAATPPRPSSDAAFDRAVALPLFVGMTDAQVGRVVAALSETISSLFRRMTR